MASPRIVTNFPSRTEKRLLRDICRKRGSNNAYATSFKRFGFSGARLLRLHFASGPIGLPFLVKIDNAADIEEEFAAIQSMKNWVRDCQLEMDAPFICKNLDDPSCPDVGALLYPHFGTNRPENADDSITLRQVLYSAEQDYPISSVEKILDCVYSDLHEAHTQVHSESQTPSILYSRYLRSGKSEYRIRGLLGQLSDQDSGMYIGADISNPCTRLTSLSPQPFSLSRVHGDLHPDNVVLHERQIPHIIDFAWCREPHDLLVDFSLMEVSSRVMCFPDRVSLDEHRIVDEYLLEEHGWRDVLSMNFSCSETTTLFQRMARIVGRIRTLARETAGGSFSLRDYLLSQFLVLYGLLAYETYSGPRGVRLLGQIALRLN